MEKKVYKVNSFTDKLPGGNPAGVVLDSGNLSEEEMQKIAKEVNFSETAFVEKIKKDYFNVRFFTPLCEVDLCGHATIAAFYLLGKKGYIKSDNKDKKTVNQETRAGKLEVELKFKNSNIYEVMMEQSRPKKYESLIDMEELANVIGIRIEEIGIENKKIYPEIISTGLKDIILPVKSKEVLNNLTIDMDKLADYSRKLQVGGLHVFYLPSLNSKYVYTRNFAPALGIDEESATGTSNGALIYYLKEKGLLKANKLIAHQGEMMRLASKIYCEIKHGKNEYIVKVGGKAVIENSKILNI